MVMSGEEKEGVCLKKYVEVFYRNICGSAIFSLEVVTQSLNQLGAFGCESQSPTGLVSGSSEHICKGHVICDSDSQSR